MVEIVERLGIERRQGWLYYVDENADVTWQSASGPVTRPIREIIMLQEEQLRVGGTEAAPSLTAAPTA